MILNNDVGTKIDVYNVISEESFSIGNIGFIFDILRNKMYKDPILAVCREIMCNARDAHREAGKPLLPIEVYIPNSLSPYFKVKDFGLGISPDRMSKVFIQYASSTKRDDNLQTGGFGLGAKSPFSYSDIFSIITISEGVRRLYNAFIDESNLGKVLLVEEKPSDEPSGTTISIPVLKNDFDAFAKKTISSSEYWDVKPKILGNTFPAWKQEKIILSGDDWLMYDHDHYHYTDDKAKALVDGIEYKIDAALIKDLSEAQKTLLKNRIFVKFQNGELSLSPSRDYLHYDEKTQSLLLKRLASIHNEIIKDLTGKIANSSSYISACLAAKNIYEWKINIKPSDATWMGNKIRTSILVRDIGKWTKFIIYEMNKAGLLKKIFYSKRKEIDLINEKIHYYHNDNNLKLIDKRIIQELCTLHKGEQVCIFSTLPNPRSKEYEKFKLINKNIDCTPKYDYDLLNLISKKISKIKFNKQVKNKNIVKDDNLVRGYILSNLYREKSKSVEVNKAGIGYYFELNSSFYEIKHEFDFYKKILQTSVIFGFSPRNVKKLGENWLSVEKLIKDKLSLIDPLSLDKIWDDIKSKKFITLYNDLDLPLENLKLTNGDFSLYLKESERIISVLDKYEALILASKALKLREFVGEKFDKNTKLDTVDNMISRLYTNCLIKYPMIKLIDRYKQNDDVIVDVIVEYVKLVDKQDKFKV